MQQDSAHMKVWISSVQYSHTISCWITVSHEVCRCKNVVYDETGVNLNFCDKLQKLPSETLEVLKTFHGDS
jgi:hypothetical protein